MKNFYTKIILTTILMLCASMSYAQLSLYIDPFEINAGEEKEILVNLSNPGTEITAVEFDLFLPAGLEVVSDEYGY
ncbi:MAG: hypothetical protein IJC92_08780, partial [Bacteroidaceae bacterium]|nr:hypothetical protein [Bacteroidaceae bacterium]